MSDVHLLSLYYQIRELPADDSSVMDVVQQLNSDTDSPLKGRIRMMDSDKSTWVKNIAMKQWLAPHLSTGGVLVSKKTAEKTQISKEYFRAVEKLWPQAWGNLKGYNLARPMGFEITIGLFGPVKHRCDLNRGRQFTADSFAPQMAPLVGATIELPGGGKLPIDWERGVMGSVANSSGRTLITKQPADLLRAADEEDT